MTVDYQNTARAWRRNKSALTRARNRGDNKRVLEVCNRAFEDFERYGYPDDWHLFNRAREDALWALRRETS